MGYATPSTRSADDDRARKARRAETAVDIKRQRNRAAARRVCRNGVADILAGSHAVVDRSVICQTAADNLQSRIIGDVSGNIRERNRQCQKFARFGKTVIVAGRIADRKSRSLQ